MQFDAVLSWCTYSSDVSSICICLQYYELIKYSDTLASANAVNEKSHCDAVIIWQSIWFPLSLGRYDKRDFVVRRLPRIRSQRTSEKASARRCCWNENEKTWAPDFSVILLDSVLSLFHFSHFLSLYLVTFCLYRFRICPSGGMAIFLGEVFIASRTDGNILHWYL